MLNLRLLRLTFREYQRDGVASRGAALAYYTIFSLPAIVIIMVSIVGSLFGKAAVEGEVFSQIRKYFNDEVALQIQNAVRNIGESDHSGWAAIVGAAVLFFGASGAFYSLQEALNHIFGAYLERPKHFLQVIINRGISLGMVLCLGFLLLTSLLLTGALSILIQFVTENHEKLEKELLQGNTMLAWWVDFLSNSFVWAINLTVSFTFITLFFALVYKILPDARLRWRFIFRGALLASLLFWGGKSLMVYYVGNAGITSAYGAAGTLVAILLWVFFSAQLLFFGAEYIKVVSLHYGVPIRPRAYAHKIIGSEWVQRQLNKGKAFLKKQFSKKSKPENPPEAK